MIAALAISAASVLVGSGLGLFTRTQSPWLVPVRTFAVAAVTSAVVVQLLPEAIAATGTAALYAFGAALLVPALLGARRSHEHERMTAHQWGTELGFVGFLAHQLVECLALGTYAGVEHAEHDHLGLFVAIAAHTLPLTAIFVTEAVTHHGKRRAVRRAALVLAATVAGFMLAGVIVDDDVLGLGQWLSAGLAGFLIHVVLHPTADPSPRTRATGVLELAGAGLGLGLPLLATQGHAHASALQAELLAALAALGVATAPMLLVGLVLAASLPRLADGERPARTPETVMLTLGFLGPAFAFVRLAAALALAAVLARLAPRQPAPRAPDQHGAWRAWLHRVDERLLVTAPWLVLALVVAAFVRVLVPADALDGLARTGIDVLAAAVLSIPASPYTAACTLLVAVLVGRGLSPGAALVLLLAPRVPGPTGPVRTWLVVPGLALALGYAINTGLAELVVPPVLAAGHRGFGLAALVVIVLGLASQLFRFGLEPWFAVVFGEHHPPHAPGEHDEPSTPP